MAYRNKIYVCFDADNDIHYYRLMLAWKQSDNSDFDFDNAHEVNKLVPSSSEDTIKQKLRERLGNAKMVIVLIGEHTRYLYKLVRWEMEQALELGLPIIGINLNGKRSMDGSLCPPVIQEELAVYVSFNAKIVQYALENWGEVHYVYKQKGEAGPYYYKDSVYSNLGL